jgi:hypothetical protein
MHLTFETAGLLWLLVLPIMWVASGVWAHGDAEKRGKPPALVAIFVMFAFWPMGWIAWVIWRPEPKPPAPRTFNLQDFRQQ